MRPQTADKVLAYLRGLFYYASMLENNILTNCH